MECAITVFVELLHGLALLRCSTTYTRQHNNALSLVIKKTRQSLTIPLLPEARAVLERRIPIHLVQRVIGHTTLNNIMRYLKLEYTEVEQEFLNVWIQGTTL